MAAQDLIIDASFWLNQQQVMEAEARYYMPLTSEVGDAPCTQASSSLASEIEKARKQIKQSLNLESSGAGGVADSQVLNRIATLEKENKELRQVTSDLQAAVKKLEAKISALEVGGSKPAPSAAKPAAAPKQEESDDDDDDFDLFGSDDEEESEALAKIKEKRLQDYAERKAKKPQLIAKSNIILDVKPWDDETDMSELEKCVRSIQMDGLLWGSSKLVPVGYGIKKLQISCVVEDDKVSTDDLEEKIVEFEDFVQSMDIAAFNKV